MGLILSQKKKKFIKKICVEVSLQNSQKYYTMQVHCKSLQIVVKNIGSYFKGCSIPVFCIPSVLCSALCHDCYTRFNAILCSVPMIAITESNPVEISQNWGWIRARTCWCLSSPVFTSRYQTTHNKQMQANQARLDSILLIRTRHDTTPHQTRLDSTHTDHARHGSPNKTHTTQRRQPWEEKEENGKNMDSDKGGNKR